MNCKQKEFLKKKIKIISCNNENNDNENNDNKNNDNENNDNENNDNENNDNENILKKKNIFKGREKNDSSTKIEFTIKQ